jgi:hypothetical protein
VVELEGGLRILLESLDDVALAAALIKSLGTAKPGKGGRTCWIWGAPRCACF